MTRKRKLVTLILPLVSTLLALVLIVGIVSAHERRTIGGGKYDVVVGFDKEPAFVNQPNAASIRITRAGTQDPVQGVDKTLKVRIAFGGRDAREFPLRAVFGQNGYYVADFVPTKAGSYIFTFVGDIEGVAVNERFESGPGRFNDVESLDAIQLPQAVPDPLAMANQVSSAQADAASARSLAIVGVALGVVGIITGGVALVTRRRTEKGPTPDKISRSQRV